MSANTAGLKSKRPYWVLLGLGGLIAVIVLAIQFPRLQTASLSASEAQALTQTLNLLKPNVDITYFTEHLGEPKIKADRTIEIVNYEIKWQAPPRKKVRQLNYLEYFYSSPYFYVQAVANEQGKVQFYSITTRSERFQPKINAGSLQGLELGKSVYHLVPKRPFKIAGRLVDSPKNTGYYEIYSVDSDTQRLEIFSSNPLGYFKDLAPLDEKNEGFLTSAVTPSTPFPLTPVHDKYRKTTVINTYSVASVDFEGLDLSARGMNFDLSKFNIGPRDDQLPQLQ